MSFIRPDLKEGSKAWTLIDAKCVEIIAKHPRLGGPGFEACLINQAIAETRDQFLPDREPGA